MALTLNGDGRISGANLNIDSDGAATLPGLTVDTNTLHVDAANNRVGVGTSSPEQILDVNGGALVTALATDGTGGVSFDLRSNRATSAQARGSFYAFGPSSTSSYQALRANYVGLYSAWADLALNADTSNSIQLWTGGNQSMRIDASGRVTMPYQPFARVRPVNGNQGSFTNAGNITCVWTDIVENVGGHYNSGNGRFTCPVAGLYEVAFNSNWYFGGSPGAYIQPRIMKNGGEVYRYYQSVFGITWHQIQGVAQLTCSAGDYLQLQNITASGTGGGADVGLYTHLTFRLIG